MSDPEVTVPDGTDVEAESTTIPRATKLKLGGVLTALAVITGILTGLGTFTFGYGKGAGQSHVQAA